MKGDKGGTAILFAILLPVVLLGAAALTLDVGSMYVMKRQLQNGADAAALAVARDCAASPADCATIAAKAKVAAGDMAPLNSDIGAGNFASVRTTRICGTIDGLTPCQGSEIPPKSWVGDHPYVLARTTGVNRPILRQLIGQGPSTIEAQSVSALAERHALIGARAPFALCVDNTDSVPGYPKPGQPVDSTNTIAPAGAVNAPLLVKNPSGIWVINPAAAGQKYPLWSNGNPASDNGNAPAVTNKCGLGSSWKGWIANERYSLPGWVNNGDGSATGHLTYLTEANPTCNIKVANGDMSGDCRFVIPVCTTVDKPSPAKGDLYCAGWASFAFTNVPPADDPNIKKNQKTIWGVFLGAKSVDSGDWSPDGTPRPGDPFILAPRIVG